MSYQRINNPKQTRTQKKEYAQMLHARRRCRERYGVELSESDYNALCKRINSKGDQRGDATFLGRQSNRLSVWRLRFERPDVDVYVVYDSYRHTIVTFLPPTAKNARGVDLTVDLED